VAKWKSMSFSDSILGTESSMLTNIQSGGLENGWIYIYVCNYGSESGLFDLPYLVSDRAQMQDLIDEGIIDEIRQQA